VIATWAIYDVACDTFHETNPETGEEWTAEQALKYALFASSDGARLFALLLIGDVAFYHLDGSLRVCPLLPNGWTALAHSTPVEHDQAGIEWIAEPFQG
jgi:hypothetical protein